MKESQLTITILVFIGINVYFIPTYIANFREHHNRLAIFLVNLLLGWSFLGWVIAIIWSSTAVNKITDNTNPDSNAVSSEMKSCPFCAESIKAEAKLCRFCNREIFANEESNTNTLTE